jgi:hypothetical protein
MGPRDNNSNSNRRDQYYDNDQKAGQDQYMRNSSAASESRSPGYGQGYGQGPRRVYHHKNRYTGTGIRDNQPTTATTATASTSTNFSADMAAPGDHNSSSNPDTV